MSFIFSQNFETKVTQIIESLISLLVLNELGAMHILVFYNYYSLNQKYKSKLLHCVFVYEIDFIVCVANYPLAEGIHVAVDNHSYHYSPTLICILSKLFNFMSYF